MSRAWSATGQADAYAWERKQVLSWLREASGGITLREATARAHASGSYWTASTERHLSELIRTGAAVARDGRYYAATSGRDGADVVGHESHACNEEG